MNTLTVIFGYSVTLSLPEIIIFLLAAVLLGFSIHFYAFGRKSVSGIRDALPGEGVGISEEDERRLQLYEQIEKHEKNEDRMQQEMSRMAETERALLEQLDEAKAEIRDLEESLENTPPNPSSTKHISDLVIAQQNLNESLFREMTDRLGKAYEEFGLLQERIHKVEAQIIDPHSRTLDYEGLEQAYFRITKEYDELKLKHLTLMEENQRQARTLTDMEEKLRDASFQKLQLTRKVAFLDELANDLQEVSGHHKRLETQLKRISEIETLLSRATDEGRQLK